MNVPGWTSRRVNEIGGSMCALAAAFVLAAACQSAVAAEISVADRAAAHIVAGEFGKAAQLLNQIEDAQAKAALSQQLAVARQQAGVAQPLAAPAADRGGVARNLLGGGFQGQGGGAMVDPSLLMEMIRNNTNGEWSEDAGTGGTMTFDPQGVFVDAKGLLKRLPQIETQQLSSSLAAPVRAADLNADLAAETDLRWVSLQRLQAEVGRRVAAGQPIPATFRHVAGLYGVRYVSFDQASGDILLGGPAGAWEYNRQGIAVSSKTGRPTLILDDLVVVFRSLASGAADFGCSINTRDESVKALLDYARESQSKGPLAPGAVRGWVNMLQKKVGRQDIEVWGIPAESRVAQVIVEADYRMKLIGIGKLDGGPNVPSYFDLLTAAEQKNPPAMEALRWWLTLQCEAISHNPERTVFELVGPAVKCLSENQFLTETGKHLPTGKAEVPNLRFAQNFTQHYAELAQRDHVFADLENIFGLALAAAIVHQEGMATQLGELGQHGSYQITSYPVPKEVDSVVNHRVYGGKNIVVQVAGGVRPDPRALLKDSAIVQQSPRLDGVREQAAAPELPAQKWWFDAAK